MHVIVVASKNILAETHEIKVSESIGDVLKTLFGENQFALYNIDYPEYTNEKHAEDVEFAIGNELAKFNKICNTPSELESVVLVFTTDIDYLVAFNDYKDQIGYHFHVVMVDSNDEVVPFIELDDTEVDDIFFELETDFGSINEHFNQLVAEQA